MIEVSDVTYRYPGAEAPAVRDVSLAVAPGDVIGIVGPNGSGKSTLGRLMKGLLLPDSGHITIDGLHSRSHGLEARRSVGLLFQNPNSQIVNAVVEHEVAFGPENLALPAPEIRSRVNEALAVVGLAGREQQECHSMSMADKQRVALAAILAMHPRYLILDEPTAWVEPALRWGLIETVLDWSRARGAGLVLVTHRMEEAEVCDRLYGMRHGEVVVEGSPDAVLTSPTSRALLALEVPDSYPLGQELERAGLPVKAGEPVARMAEALWQS